MQVSSLSVCVLARLKLDTSREMVGRSGSVTPDFGTQDYANSVTNGQVAHDGGELMGNLNGHGRWVIKLFIIIICLVAQVI